MVKLRFASEADLPKIKSFIDDHWKKGHILAHDTELIRWQHGNNATDLDFVLCEEKVTASHQRDRIVRNQ